VKAKQSHRNRNVNYQRFLANGFMAHALPIRQTH